MRFIITALLCVVMGNHGIAQLENIPLLTVFGEGIVKVKPDHVILGIKVSKQIRFSSQSIAGISEIFRDEDTRIKLFDFDNNNISESLIQIKDAFYVKEIFVTIKDVEKLDRYLLELYKQGYKDYIYLDYRVSNYSNHKDQAKQKAIASARKRATLMANQLGQSIGKAHLIEELDFQDYNWYNIRDNKEVENVTFKLGADEYIIEPGFLVLTSKIRVSFDLQK